MGEAYGKAAVKKTHFLDMHKRFRDGRASVNDRRPSASVNDDNFERVRCDR
jgi:hypothetical protein